MPRYRRIRNQKSEIRNQKSEIRNQKSEIRNQKSEIRNQKSEINYPLNTINYKLLDEINFTTRNQILFRFADWLFGDCNFSVAQRTFPLGF
ncbi:hypothetical protein FJA49_13745 [Flavobacterium microcysteis]|uniref:Uncharacterized protein n=1 Tax=Flavobacterium microcysteis TaxID=2596891 RepID=A0A501Q370_9FLAO|nr:hypothetical protein FJA49_13745 [Flavobacterium microcysteis]